MAPMNQWEKRTLVKDMVALWTLSRDHVNNPMDPNHDRLAWASTHYAEGHNLDAPAAYEALRIILGHVIFDAEFAQNAIIDTMEDFDAIWNKS